MKNVSVVAIALALVSCGGTPGGTSPGTSSNWVSSANGSITSSDSGSTVSGSITSGQIWAAHYAASTSTGNVDLGIIDLVASYQPGSSSNTGSLTFTKPVGASAITLISTIGIKGTPATGDYTQASSNACGALVFEIQTGNAVAVYSAASPYDCQDSNTNSVPAGSTFDLHLSSISVLDASGNVVVPGSGTASWAYYKVSGTLTAKLVNASDASQPSVTVSLTF